MRSYEKRVAASNPTRPGCIAVTADNSPMFPAGTYSGSWLTKQAKALGGGHRHPR